MNPEDTYTLERIMDMYHDLQTIEALHRDLSDELQLLGMRVKPAGFHDRE